MAEEKKSESNSNEPAFTTEIESNWEGVCSTFEDIGLKRDVLKGIYAYGFEKPSPIQQRAIAPFLTGRDLIAQAQSGSGKTATFSLGVLERTDVEKKQVQAIMLAPTRELADQIYKFVMAAGEYLGVKTHLCIGGTSVAEDTAILEQGVHIVVGTPGRVKDLMGRRSLDTSNVTMFVLDEADEMLSRGFKDDVYEIFRYLPVETQVGLFSATMPEEVLELTEKFMRDPIRILVKKEELTLEGIKQFYVAVERDEFKVDTLIDLYEHLSVAQAVIFCNTRRRADMLTEAMSKNDFTVSCLHGELLADERKQIMREFRSGSSRVLISTDVLSRGIDVPTVSLVLNFDMPKNRETYLHRIGRSGRYGKKGVAINFITSRDVEIKEELERFYETNIEELPGNFSSYLEF